MKAIRTRRTSASFWPTSSESYDIEHKETLRRALEIISGGADLEHKRALGMGANELAHRARVLEDPAARWGGRTRDREMTRALEARAVRVRGRRLFRLSRFGGTTAQSVRPGEARRVLLQGLSLGAERLGAGIVLSRSHRYEGLRGLRGVSRQAGRATAPSRLANHAARRQSARFDDADSCGVGGVDDLLAVCQPGCSPTSRIARRACRAVRVHDPDRARRAWRRATAACCRGSRPPCSTPPRFVV